MYKIPEIFCALWRKWICANCTKIIFSILHKRACQSSNCTKILQEKFLRQIAQKILSIVKLHKKNEGKNSSSICTKIKFFYFQFIFFTFKRKLKVSTLTLFLVSKGFLYFHNCFLVTTKNLGCPMLTTRSDASSLYHVKAVKIKRSHTHEVSRHHSE